MCPPLVINSSVAVYVFSVCGRTAISLMPFHNTATEHISEVICTLERFIAGPTSMALAVS